MARGDNNHWAEYGERMDRVTAYVFDHLDDALDLNRLAEVACLSPYHWHRIYHAMRGETIAATVRRLRTIAGSAAWKIFCWPRFCTRLAPQRRSLGGGTNVSHKH